MTCTKKSLILAIAAVAILIPTILITGPGCSRPVGTGDDSIRLQSFLEVTAPGDSWSISDDPTAKVTNIGPTATEVQVFRLTLVADDDVDMIVPEECGLMYEDMVDEMVLIVHCTGYWLEQGESLVMDFPVTGPWHYLELTSIYSRNELGDVVHNTIGTNQPLMWFNQNY